MLPGAYHPIKAGIEYLGPLRRRLSHDKYQQPYVVTIFTCNYLLQTYVFLKQLQQDTKKSILSS